MGKPGPHTVILNQVATEILKPAGMVRIGRSRRWWCDCGYFLVEIEFQPHSWQKGTFCNIATIFLWNSDEIVDRHLRWDACVRVHFTGKLRKALGGDNQFVAYDGDDEVFRERCVLVVQEALRRVERYRQMTDLNYARYYVDEVWDDVNRSKWRHALSMLEKLAGEEGPEGRRQLIDQIARRRQQVRELSAYKQLPEEFVVLEPNQGPFSESRSWKRRLQRFFMGL